MNPTKKEIESVPVKTLTEALMVCNPATTSISLITPPAASLIAVREAISAGVTRIWLQPGAESKEVMQYAQDKGVALIAGGPCVLVELGVAPHAHH